ncbi:MAG TPA: restriction endonuclease, partial [Opitutaceae bacterium]|nr:restriction endonuclease [Opitutaceae bacterium]
PVIPDATESVFTTRTYLIALAIIVGGIGYLIWRRRQRQLELAATTVSHSPFGPEMTAPAASGARFTTDLLGKLEWKRFEELVAAYYNKTGVVATRTKTGPGSPVHIRISWKGETRPFACVHCVAHPSALIDLAPIQALQEILAAEDIRRGYVVTSGKFGVPARDLAEEKQITLLPGEVFAEKLNALPELVRNELMKDATAGDYAVPTCPKCEIKMVRSEEDSSQWQCLQCGTLLPR